MCIPTADVYFCYMCACALGMVVSLEVLNNLLALLAYEGTGNKKANEYDPSQMVINWPPKGPLSPSARGRQREVTDEAEKEALKAMENLQEELQPARDGEWCGNYVCS